MNILYQGSSAVKTERAHTLNTAPFNPLDGASILEWFKYYDGVAKRAVTMAVGYDNGVACSDRTRGGKLHESNAFNVRRDLLDTLRSGGYDIFLIRIHWKRLGQTIHYSAPLTTIEQLGTLENRYDSAQWSLPLAYWSVDGQPPAGLPQVKPAPVAEQPALFDFAEPRRLGAY